MAVPITIETSTAIAIDLLLMDRIYASLVALVAAASAIATIAATTVATAVVTAALAGLAPGAAGAMLAPAGFAGAAIRAAVAVVSGRMVAIGGIEHDHSRSRIPAGVVGVRRHERIIWRSASVR